MHFLKKNLSPGTQFSAPYTDLSFPFCLIMSNCILFVVLMSSLLCVAHTTVVSTFGMQGLINWRKLYVSTSKHNFSMHLDIFIGKNTTTKEKRD